MLYDPRSQRHLKSSFINEYKVFHVDLQSFLIFTFIAMASALTSLLPLARKRICFQVRLHVILEMDLLPDPLLRAHVLVLKHCRHDALWRMLQARNETFERGWNFLQIACTLVDAPSRTRDLQ